MQNDKEFTIFFQNSLNSKKKYGIMNLLPSGSTEVKGRGLMKRYMQNYESYLQQKLEQPDDQTDWTELRKETLVQIGLMQHERLIHFLVTMLFALLLMAALGLLLYTPSIGMLLFVVLLLALLIPYIAHYYFLENTVQRMYILYNQCAAKADDVAYPNTNMTEKL